MIRPRWLPPCFLLLVLSACGGGGDPPPEGIGLPARGYYVDEAGGDDANPGTFAEPFATISKAIDVVQSGDVIRVAPGYYTPIYETFPLMVPAHVRLVGDPDHWGGSDDMGGIPPTVIRGGALGGLPQTPPFDITTSIVLAEGSSLEGFHVHRDRPRGPTTTSELGVRVWGHDVTIEKCRFFDLNQGVVYEQPPGGPIPQGGHYVGNTILQTNVGVILKAGVQGVRVSSNWFYYSLGAVEMNGPGIDLGGGAAGSAGLNTFGCNASDITAHGSGYTVYAMGNFWDRLPVTVDYHQDTDSWSQIESDHGITFLFGATLGSVTCPEQR